MSPDVYDPRRSVRKMLQRAPAFTSSSVETRLGARVQGSALPPFPTELSGGLQFLHRRAPLLPVEGDTLEAAAAELYAELFLSMRAANVRPLRIWNFVPDINRGADANGWGPSELYKRFNRGRRAAWLREDPTLSSVCAATAVGRQDALDLLDVYVLAARSPLVHLENPRQVPFLEYSESYGPPPCSRRATLLESGEVAALFVAGTASIVGEASLHVSAGGLETLGRQTEETLANVELLLRGTFITAAWTCGAVRVYLRRMERAEEVRATIARRLAVAGEEIEFIPADICRRPLEIEIECMALAAAGAIRVEAAPLPRRNPG